MHKIQALIVDDEPDILELLGITLGRMDISTLTAATLAEARRRLEEHRCDFCLTDMSLPDGSGIELIRHIAERYPELPVAMITAHGNMTSAVEAMKAGAFDFVSKPVDLKLLRQIVGAALKLRVRGGPGASAAAAAGEPLLLGDSPVMASIRQLIGKLARTQAPVFIAGESGTGKELAARLIHARGPRHAGPFVPVNCGAIPQDLVESELFGHRKGSFTGASSDREGLFQAARGGTLFLDEIADLPLPAQVKLLRAIQEKCVRPVGAQQEVPVDARILSASHRDLAREVEQGHFRQDLYYRINVIELRMPALREHPEDLPLLANHLLIRMAGEQGRDQVPTLSPGALEALARRPFPGNVRELENLLERTLALCDASTIEARDLDPSELAGGGAWSGVPSSSRPAGQPHRPQTERTAWPAADPAPDFDPALLSRAWTDDELAAAAARLGISPGSLRYRLRAARPR